MFPCTQCGECCKRVGGSEATRFLDRGDGVCRHYQEGAHLCAIYAERPLVCRIDDAFELGDWGFLARTEYYRLNAEFCNAWQEAAGQPQRFRVSTGGV